MTASLVLVSGAPGSGKTTLARMLAEDLGMALLSKDTIKEALGDTLGAESVERSQELGRASVVVLRSLTEAQLELGIPVVVDHVLRPAFAAEWLPVVEAANGVHVHCRAPVEVLVQRVEERWTSGMRHAVHLDLERIGGEWEGLEPVEFDIPTLFVDTEDGYRPDYPTIVDFVEHAGRRS
jgi:predicted kinase